MESVVVAGEMASGQFVPEASLSTSLPENFAMTGSWTYRLASAAKDGDEELPWRA